MRKLTASLAVLLMLLFCVCTNGKQMENFPKARKKQKVSHLHFYFHDIVSGKNATATEVASSAMTKSSPTAFGSMSVMDDPLTETPDMNSKIFGYMQGIYTSACQREFRLLMAATFVFKSGEYNGSTLAVLGNTNVFNTVREMPIVGGTGLFRLARGYTHAHTLSVDMDGNALVEYNATVFHY